MLDKKDIENSGYRKKKEILGRGRLLGLGESLQESKTPVNYKIDITLVRIE